MRDARFTHVHFDKMGRFTDSTFEGPTRFDFVVFDESAKAWFSNASFKAFVSFAGAQFGSEALFEAVHAERRFTLDSARFAQVPNFKQAHFSEAPTLDDVVIPEVPCAGKFVWHELIRKGHTTGNAAEYQALKRLAIQAHGHKLELDFFASEVKASGGATRWTVGLLYELFSNFGRCWLLPLFWLTLTWAISAWAYLATHFAAAEAAGRAYGISSLRWIVRWIASGFSSPTGLSCIKTSSTDPLSASGLLSLAKTLPYGGVLPDTKSVQISECLYGSSIPGGVVVVGIVQLLLSLVLLFLFLLAVRNHFRIR